LPAHQADLSVRTTYHPPIPKFEPRRKTSATRKKIRGKIEAVSTEKA